jgi:hypothetical protein
MSNDVRRKKTLASGPEPGAPKGFAPTALLLGARLSCDHFVFTGTCKQVGPANWVRSVYRVCSRAGLFTGGKRSGISLKLGSFRQIARRQTLSLFLGFGWSGGTTKTLCKGKSPRYNGTLSSQPRTFYLSAVTRLLAATLAFSLTWSELASPAAAQNALPRIDIVVVSGEGAVNSLRQPVSQDPVVRISDQNNQLVSGASVTFNLPIAETSGEFPNGAKNITVVTGEDGLAAARGLRTNDVPGRFQILVTASYRGLTARALISQTNQGTPVAQGHHAKLVAILVLIGAAAAGGAVYATRRGSSSSSSSAASAPIGITPGTGTIANP